MKVIQGKMATMTKTIVDDDASGNDDSDSSSGSGGEQPCETQVQAWNHVMPVPPVPPTPGSGVPPGAGPPPPGGDDDADLAALLGTCGPPAKPTPPSFVYRDIAYTQFTAGRWYHPDEAWPLILAHLPLINYSLPCKRIVMQCVFQKKYGWIMRRCHHGREHLWHGIPHPPRRAPNCGHRKSAKKAVRGKRCK